MNIGVFLAHQLQQVGIADLETLRAVGAVEAWLRIRDVHAEAATVHTLVVLAAAERGVRTGTLGADERRCLLEAVARGEKGT